MNYHDGSRKKQKINHKLDKEDRVLGVPFLSCKRNCLAGSWLFYFKMNVLLLVGNAFSALKLKDDLVIKKAPVRRGFF
jgi:hypothetical protein